jgi:hypothetical protein
MKSIATVRQAFIDKALTGDISEQDWVDLCDATEAGAGIELQTAGAAAAATVRVISTPWQPMASSGGVNMWSTGTAIPANGGYGLTPNLANGTLTCEAGGAGKYEIGYHVNVTANQLTEFAIERNRGGVFARGVNSRCAATVLSACSASYIVDVNEGDVLTIVARTGNGLTCDMSIWSAQWTALRVLATG